MLSNRNYIQVTYVDNQGETYHSRIELEEAHFGNKSQRVIMDTFFKLGDQMFQLFERMRKNG